MLPVVVSRKQDGGRLRNLLALLFLALAAPTAVLVWQAWDRLKWESWFQYRSQAEALASRIDAELAERVAAEEARGFAEFAFLSATTAANVQQRSPLSAYPVAAALPGLIGYFQVGPDGSFSTPLLPPGSPGAGEIGMTEAELAGRVSLAAEMRRILRDNRLVEGFGSPAASAEAPAPATPEEAKSTASAADSTAAFQGDMREQESLAEPVAANTEFDDRDTNAGVRTYGKLNELQLDEGLARRNEQRTRQVADAGTPAERRLDAPLDDALEKASAPATSPPARGRAGKEEDAITTFASDLEPFEFSLLGGGHIVLYRNAWQDGNRYVQGLLMDQATFMRDVLELPFRSDTLAGMSDLVVGYRDDVIALFRGDRYAGMVSGTGELEGSLLYRSRLSAPFDRIELVFAINRLPAGPGGAVLAWTAAVLAVVFIAGFLALYRLGLGQIRLARQQQDFVSAVSHELKTPLTSIRMYGEMLKEGWVDADKQKQYFEYIHDESERLSRLIANVLQLAKITRSSPELDLKPVTAGVLLDQVVSRIASQVERAGFELDVEADEVARSATVCVDGDGFTQVVINLVDNAIKFSRNAAERRIVLGCRRDAAGKVTFSVRDFGPGIPRDQLRKIFGLFYRAESELTRETVGTGIGLAIVHQLSQAMGGDVDVVNCAPGAEFRISFPGRAKTA